MFKTSGSRLAAIFLVFVALDSPAFAYLDGATGSIILQAMIGLVASWMVYFRVFKERAQAYLGKITRKASSQKDAE
jgi:hypothetical protein